MGLFNVDTDIQVRLTLTKKEGGVDSYTIRVGDMITNMVVMGKAEPISGQVIEIGVELGVRNRNSNTVYDGIPVLQKEIDHCRMVRKFEEIVEVRTFVIHDPKTCEHYHVKLPDIESIETIVPGRVVVNPTSGKIADAIASMTEGQILYLDAGEYEEDLTLTTGVVIMGAGNGVVTLKGNVEVNMTEPTDYAVIGDVKITNTAAANKGMITVTAGNLHLINDVLVVTEAAGVAECSAVNRAVTSADADTRIIINNCTIQVDGGEADDFNYGISIGTKVGTDLGKLTMHIQDTTILSNYVGVYCTTRGLVNLTAVRSKFVGFGAFYMNHNGENEIAGTFDATFKGSEVKFVESKLVGVQSNLASLDEEGCDCNTFATVAISNSKNLKASIVECIVKAENDVAVADSGNALFAPMYAIMLDDKSEGCLVDLQTVTLKLMDPVVTAATLNGNPTYSGIKEHNVKTIGFGFNGGSYPFYVN